MTLPREFRVGVLSSLVAGFILGAIGMLSDLVVVGRYNESRMKAVLLCLYAALALGGAYVLASTQPSRIDHQARIPRFSRQVKVLTVVMLALGAASITWAFLPYSIPSLKIQARNHSRYGIVFPDEAVFYIVIPDSPTSQHIIDRGLCKFSWLQTPQRLDKPLLIFQDETAELRCDIINPKEYRRYLESGKIDLQLILNPNNGNAVSAVSHFDEHTLKNHWFVFDLSQ